MALIDWAGLARTALWIVGLSIVLAGFSHASWQAARQGVRLRGLLARPAFQIMLAGGLALFAAGLAWGSTRRWERLAWLALLLLFAWQGIGAARLLRRQHRESKLS